MCRENIGKVGDAFLQLSHVTDPDDGHQVDVRTMLSSQLHQGLHRLSRSFRSIFSPTSSPKPLTRPLPHTLLLTPYYPKSDFLECESAYSSLLRFPQLRMSLQLFTVLASIHHGIHWWRQSPLDLSFWKTPISTQRCTLLATQSSWQSGYPS